MLCVGVMTGMSLSIAYGTTAVTQQNLGPNSPYSKQREGKMVKFVLSYMNKEKKSES